MRARTLLACAGKYDVQLLCMPDSWVGCDKAVPIKLKVRACRTLPSAWHCPVVLQLENSVSPSLAGAVSLNV